MPDPVRRSYRFSPGPVSMRGDVQSGCPQGWGRGSYQVTLGGTTHKRMHTHTPGEQPPAEQGGEPADS